MDGCVCVGGGGGKAQRRAAPHIHGHLCTVFHTSTGVDAGGDRRHTTAPHAGMTLRGASSNYTRRWRKREASHALHCTRHAQGMWAGAAARKPRGQRRLTCRVCRPSAASLCTNASHANGRNSNADSPLRSSSSTVAPGAASGSPAVALPPPLPS
eukprot:365213-Chlamydomonas_euryale.AAC.2